MNKSVQIMQPAKQKKKQSCRRRMIPDSSSVSLSLLIITHSVNRPIRKRRRHFPSCLPFSTAPSENPVASRKPLFRRLHECHRSHRRNGGHIDGHHGGHRGNWSRLRRRRRSLFLINLEGAVHFRVHQGVEFLIVHLMVVGKFRVISVPIFDRLWLWRFGCWLDSRRGRRRLKGRETLRDKFAQ
jgi:hypothetical protein